ncbi:cysteine desulfurase NifS [Paracraurococcus lichenis]|uniref:Cysteine desulfurase n=1 Tax=Paracraurococcus lichenis TaxID=3064888 RepID=A0ABT9DYV4_9PROT|nr:cysteine desulfurase NifS [Paracraurococcus sp. LOR1-02]MDO9708930.1 cysteine desulfurase NifS [Paracraurococcus sp. LOR1-02]
MGLVYLDNNATTRTDVAVIEAMLPYFREVFGNPSSTHALGADVGGAVRQARRQVQALLGAAHDHEVVFTSGGTESDNAALLSALETQAGRDEIVTTTVEHPAILQCVEHLQQSRGIRVHRIGVDAGGRLDMGAFRAALGPRTAVASAMWANNETGTIFPVEELAALAHAAGALFHTDAVQAAGRLPMALKGTEIDMLSLSGHKLHGPKGIGALYVRKGVPFRPLLRGGRQERGRRGGTENVPAIIGLGKAAELAAQHLPAERTRVAALRDRLEQGILRLGGSRVNGDTARRLPNTSNLAFDHIDSEALLLRLGRAGIAASSGAACASGSTEPSHVLRAMDLPEVALHGALRLSLSRETTPEDIDRTLAAMAEILPTLRAQALQALAG